MSHPEKVSTLIVGASMLGLGILSGKGENALLLESGNSVGSEFIRSFKLARTAYSSVTSKGRELEQEMAGRNISGQDGRLHLPGLMPVLIKLIVEDKLNVRMQTSVLDVKEHKGKYEVQVYDASGLRTIWADEVIDTTLACSTRPADFRCKSKHVNLIVRGLPDSLPAEEIEGFAVLRGRFGQETVLQFPLDPQDGWITARNKLFEFWLNRPGALVSSAFVTHADEFDMTYDMDCSQIGSCWSWRPSGYYASPLEAFDHGIHIGKGGC
ncbi:hypothetical protein [Paenibacillus gansuensis]|uniref:Uncharacterized protein n=1 Tax=Paenibacillus gansuensis TaxID=306542 RepID=A0ABW5P9Q2_9BACL